MWEVPFLLRIPDDVHSAFVQLGADEPSVQPLIGGAEAIPRDKEEWHDGQDRQHKARSREDKRIDAERLFELKQQKKREKHLGH